MNHLLSTLIPLLSLVSTPLEDGSLPFTRVEESWLENPSADPETRNMSVTLVDSPEELRELPLAPSDVRPDAFGSFDFSTRVLLFAIHPRPSTSADLLDIQRVRVEENSLQVEVRFSRPRPECVVTTDHVLHTDVVALDRARLGALANSRPQVTLVQVRRDCR